MMGTETFGPLGAPKYREYVDDIAASAHLLLDVISDVLDVSAVEAGQIELQVGTVDPGALMEACVRLIAGRATAKDVSIEFSADPDLPPIWADERRIKQILINLLSNAVKFTLPGGEVRLWGKVEWSGACRLRVQDTGIGIAQADIPKVLASFGQVQGPLQRTHEGTGLGLPLAKTLAELHGGSLELESELGVGTTVTVYLPGPPAISR
jgi:signal transduction histidine kinase